MSKKTRKSDSDKAEPATEASAVELEESDLDDTVGGAAYVKFNETKGDYLKAEWPGTGTVDSLKIGDSVVLSSKTLKR